jgi:hypothetical protein
VDDLCSALGRNAACYGASDVDSITMANPRPANFFLAPGDTAPLVEFREINPQPLDETTRTFGVGLLNVQANLPNTLPGQGVLFMLVGGARMTNEVTLGSTALSPFQAFYFFPGIGGARCYEAEPMMVIQTPGNMSINLTFNGIDTEMAPGTLLTITDSVCTIHRGNIIQRVGDKTDVLVANQTVDIHIDEAGNIVVDNARGISEREFVRGQEIQATINQVAVANGWDEQTVSMPIAFDVEPTTASCETEHTVARGETLSSIARQYNTSVQSIIDANQLTDPDLINPGLVLCIPASDGTPPAAYAANAGADSTLEWWTQATVDRVLQSARSLLDRTLR